MRKNRNVVPIMVLVSDGKGNVPIKSSVRDEVISLAGELKEQGINLVVIDSNHGLLNLGYNREIAEVGGGEYCRLTELDSKGIVNIVKPLRTFADRVKN
jgi:magnesium chelatase subunit D